MESLQTLVATGKELGLEGDKLVEFVREREERERRCSCKRGKKVPVLVLLFVALWFILRGDLLYVFPCVILLLCFSVLLVLRLPRLGKRELILVLFVRLFGLYLFRFVDFLFLLGSRRGCVCDCGTHWTFLLPFLRENIKGQNKSSG